MRDREMDELTVVTGWRALGWEEEQEEEGKRRMSRGSEDDHICGDECLICGRIALRDD